MMTQTIKPGHATTGLWRYKTHKEVKSKDNLGKYIRRILKSEDVVIGIYGRKGSGKSWTALALCEMIDPKFSLDNVTFTLEDFFKQMSKADNRSRAFLLDDFGSELDPGEFNEVTGKMTSHFFQKSRTFTNAYIITTPNRAFINKTMRDRLCDYYAEITGKNKKEGVTKLKFAFIQVNQKTGKTYYHSLKLQKNNKLGLMVPGRKMTFYKIPKPGLKLRKAYVKLRGKIGDEQLKKSAAGIIEHKNQFQYLYDQLLKDNTFEKYKREYRKRVFLDYDDMASDYDISINMAKRLGKKLLANE